MCTPCYNQFKDSNPAYKKMEFSKLISEESMKLYEKGSLYAVAFDNITQR
jgi:hypothetical protein